MAQKTALKSAPLTRGAAPAERVSARERLLASATELFYEEGFNAVGIDRVIAHAGVAKASLYDCFGSKEELVRSYLAQRHEARQARIAEGLRRFETPRGRLLGVFDLLAELVVDTGFRGCAFVKADAQAKADSPVREVLDASRNWMRELFTRLAREAGVADAEGLARQLVILYDGAIVSAQMDHDAQAVSAARGMAATLVDAAGAAR